MLYFIQDFIIGRYIIPYVFVCISSIINSERLHIGAFSSVG